MDSLFIKDSRKANHCFGSANLRNAKYVFFNKQLTKEEYESKMKEIDLGSYKTYQEMKAKAKEVWKNSIPHPYHEDFCEGCTGNYVFYSKNCKECYECGYCEDCKYMMLIKTAKVKDSYDYTDWGENASRIYEGITVGNNVADVRFSQDIHNSHNVEYSKSCMSDSYLFACSGVRSKKYVIFNKEYSKEEFDSLRKKLITQMNEHPYVSKDNHSYKYGEFFPLELSPHDYNDTFANLLFPLTKEEAENKGLSWLKASLSEYEVSLEASELPDHIKDADESILKEIIKCMSCKRGYKVTPQELSFLKKYNFPLPRKCPFCRIEEKVRVWAKQMTMVDRDCDKCGKIFRMSYTKEDAKRVYCKECYLAEVV